jgi:hypothetical protein
MTMRKTPNLRLRYPWADDVVSAADVQSMGNDIDSALVQTATLANNFSKFASVAVSRSTAQSIVKGTLTAITFDTVALNNGANSPLSNGGWYSAAAPTRLTAPTACVVVASGFGGFNITTALGASACIEVAVALNGAVGAPGIQGGKYQPGSTTVQQQWTSALSMWKLAAGDFLELKMFWTGTPAGPMSTDPGIAPSLALMMIALPTVS